AAVAGLPAPVPSAPPLSASTGGLDAHGTLPLCPLLSVTSAAPPAARASPLLRRHLKTIDRRAPRRFFGRLTGAADMECLSWPDGRVRGPGPQRAAITTPSGEETPLPKAVPRMPGTVSRRALLRRGAVLGGAALPPPWTAGCTPAPVLHEDLPVLAGAIASEQNLIASYEAVLSAQPSLAARLDPVLARHREHLAVLKRHYVPGSGDRADEGGGIPAPRAVPMPGGPGGDGALEALRRAEDRAAAARTADAAKAAPGLAQLLASVGACEAGHAMLASGGPPAVRSRSGAEAVRAALRAEHAAVYGYGVLGARLRGPLRRTATAVW